MKALRPSRACGVSTQLCFCGPRSIRTKPATLAAPTSTASVICAISTVGIPIAKVVGGDRRYRHDGGFCKHARTLKVNELREGLSSFEHAAFSRHFPLQRNDRVDTAPATTAARQ